MTLTLEFDPLFLKTLTLLITLEQLWYLEWVFLFHCYQHILPLHLDFGVWFIFQNFINLANDLMKYVNILSHILYWKKINSWHKLKVNTSFSGSVTLLIGATIWPIISVKVRVISTLYWQRIHRHSLCTPLKPVAHCVPNSTLIYVYLYLNTQNCSVELYLAVSPVVSFLPLRKHVPVF